MKHRFRLLCAIIIAVNLAMITTPAMAQSMRITRSGFGCQSREYYDKISGCVSDGDKEAFEKTLMVGILSGECTLFKVGEEVFLTDTAIFSMLVKVRRKGEIVEYWINSKAIE